MKIKIFYRDSYHELEQIVNIFIEDEEVITVTHSVALYIYKFAGSEQYKEKHYATVLFK